MLSRIIDSILDDAMDTLILTYSRDIKDSSTQLVENTISVTCSNKQILPQNSTARSLNRITSFPSQYTRIMDARSTYNWYNYEKEYVEDIFEHLRQLEFKV